MIAIVDNLISNEEAKYFFEQVCGFKNTEPSAIFFGRYVYSINDLFLNDSIFVKTIKTIENIANQFCQNIEVDYAQLVVWPEGTEHAAHYDIASEETIFTSITYINCAYRGGETFFSDGTSIAPVVGRTVFFDGKKYFHGVRSINNGLRVTLPIWYKLKKMVDTNSIVNTT